jgi:hypothetical protein
MGQVIPILKNAGHRVIAVQLPLNSLADDVATVKRAIKYSEVYNVHEYRRVRNLNF